MDQSRFDRISKSFAQRRARHVLAQEATAAPDQPAHVPELLFVQTFRAGAIAPKAGADGHYTLALEGGSSQTIYFSERPDRIVGTTPTATIANRIGFPDDDPPNAALVFEAAPGDVDVAVVELFSPVYDEKSGGITYEVAPLANWHAELGVGLQETPTDLANVASNFGTAHLFIDGIWDCPDSDISCTLGDGSVVGKFANEDHDGFCSTWGRGAASSQVKYCLPCNPWIYQGDIREAYRFWATQCNRRFEGCNGECSPKPWCAPDPGEGKNCPNW
jgi:hypothetical protein